MPEIPPTPQHDKLKALDGANDTVGEFLEWLSSLGIHLMEWIVTDEAETCSGTMFHDCAEGKTEYGRTCTRCQGTGKVNRHFEGWVNTGRSTSQLIADHFDIDAAALDLEKRALLEYVRSQPESPGLTAQ